MVQFTIGGVRGEKDHFPHHDVFHKDVVLAEKTRDVVTKLLRCRFMVEKRSKNYLTCPRASSGR